MNVKRKVAGNFVVWIFFFCSVCVKILAEEFDLKEKFWQSGSPDL